MADVQVRKLEAVGPFIDGVRQTATAWMQLRGINGNPHQHAHWREAWHSNKLQVWGRLAEEAEDCKAIFWLHGPYPSTGSTVGTIYRSSVTGKVGQIGKLWHRMYPLVRLVKNPKEPNGKPIPRETKQYLELLTFFPDDSPTSRNLLKFLQSQQTVFQQLW